MQERDLRETLSNIVRDNKRGRAELAYLRDENKKLRNISY